MKKIIYFLLVVLFVFGCKKEEKPFNSDCEYDGQPCPETPTITWGGQAYSTIQIGTQCWMGENLNIGIMINGQKDMVNNDTIEKYCYDNDPNNCDIYGGLYQWDELMKYTTHRYNQGICPDGWRLPILGDWYILEDYLGGNDHAGGRLKAEGFDYRKEPNEGATNESGFSGLPSGIRDTDGSFIDIGEKTIYTTSEGGGSPVSVNSTSLTYSYSGFLTTFRKMKEGLSVRCVKE